MIRPSLVAGGLLALAVSGAAQTSVVHLSDPSGLAAVARFELTNAGNTLRVHLRNTTTGLPSGFAPSDQLLSLLGWDFGAPGANPSDPRIASGSVRTGPNGKSLNFDVASVGPDEDVSGEYGFGNSGFGNSGAPSLAPNFVSCRDFGQTPFGGANLHGATPLSGPEAGLVARGTPLPPVVEGALEDELLIELNLDQPLTNLSFLAQNGVLVEFGKGAAFATNDCDHDARTRPTPDPGGLNAPNSLAATSRPTIGNPRFTLALDDPGNVCGITPGVDTYVALSPAPASVLMPGWGCRPGDPGELMVDLTTMVTWSGPLPWRGPGSPAVHAFSIPADPALCRLLCYGQGAWLDDRGASGPVILSNRLDLIVGI